MKSQSCAFARKEVLVVPCQADIASAPGLKESTGRFQLIVSLAGADLQYMGKHAHLRRLCLWMVKLWSVHCSADQSMSGESHLLADLSDK